MKIIKRDGHIVDYMPEKIENAIKKANNEVPVEEQVTDIQIKNIIKYIENMNKKRMLVEDIQDIIEVRLMALGKFELAKKYITYRYTRALVRRSNTTDLTIRELIDSESDSWGLNSSSKKVKNVAMQRDYLAGITSTDITKRLLLPEDIVKAHDEGIIHFHGAEYFAQNALHNCSLINLEDMLQNGTVINGVLIEKAHKFLTAMSQSTQIITAVLSNQYGDATITLSHLAPFIRDSYKRYVNLYKSRGLDEDKIEEYAQADLKKEIRDGVQIFLYQVNSLSMVNGKNPLLSVFMYLGETSAYKKELAMLIEEFLHQKIEDIKNASGEYIDFESPRLIYVLEKDNVSDNSKYYNLTSLAIRCMTNKKTLDFISEKKMKENSIDCYPYMRKNFFLTNYKNNKNIAKEKTFDAESNKYYGRFNQGIVTINLVDVALSSNKYFDDFWNILDERLELSHRTLQVRHKRLSKITSDISPVLWQHGALARLDESESIHDLLHHDYSTITLGYAGLYECVKYMTGYSYLDNEEGKSFALKIMECLKKACQKWSELEDIDYTIYGISNMNVNRLFVKTLKERFGNIRGITDKEAITNYFVINNYQSMGIIDKLTLEEKIQEVNVCETSSKVRLADNEYDDLTCEEIIDYIYKNLVYVRINEIEVENE